MLPRSHKGMNDCSLEIPTNDKTLSARLFFKKYPTDDEYVSIPFIRNENMLTTLLPYQHPNEQLAYYLEFTQSNGKVVYVAKENPVVIQFKGEVPNWLRIAHASAMSLALFFSILLGFMTWLKVKIKYVKVYLPTILLFIGGLLLGPMVKFYTSGEYWTGIPIHYSFTESLTLLAFIAWLTAFYINKKRDNSISIYVALIVTLTIFFFPHS
jgi:hypothetical protein